ncbi:hypothetical protein [Plasmodium yoelii yoelii]|uniref:Uncharacterized protein n=1 Tax=Plasmodium yoelii yoelii TaxID=73239 RepID=Q7RSP1_PLAYO|nr:hypothetical protein [Plasmodium yoelii yoelii]
MIQVISFTK